MGSVVVDAGDRAASHPYHAKSFRPASRVASAADHPLPYMCYDLAYNSAYRHMALHGVSKKAIKMEIE